MTGPRKPAWTTCFMCKVREARWKPMNHRRIKWDILDCHHCGIVAARKK